jgi:flagellar protein FliO/FliZ
MRSLTQSRGVALAGALMLSLWQSASALAYTKPAGSAATGENTPLNLSGSTPGTHVSSGGGASIVRTIVGLFIVIAVIYGVAWVLKRAKRDRSTRAHGDSLNSIASMPLGSGRSLQLVRAGSDVLLLGVAEHGVTPIQRYTEAEAINAGFEVPSDDFVVDEPGDDTPLGRIVDVLRRMTVRS